MRNNLIKPKKATKIEKPYNFCFLSQKAGLNKGKPSERAGGGEKNKRRPQNQKKPYKKPKEETKEEPKIKENKEFRKKTRYLKTMKNNEKRKTERAQKLKILF